MPFCIIITLKIILTWSMQKNKVIKNYVLDPDKFILKNGGKYIGGKCIRGKCKKNNVGNRNFPTLYPIVI